MNQDWRKWSREKLEHEYSPSEWAKHPYAEYAKLFQDRSDLVRLTLGSALAVDSYGPRPSNIIAWTPPTALNDVFLWIHGGYWQGSSIAEALIGADDLASQGYGFAAVEYTLAPEVSIAEMITECVNALAWLRERNAGSSVILGGHSAGAHLALAVAQQSAVDGLVLVSGVFDLRPIVSTSINDALALNEMEAFGISPVSVEFPHACASEVLVGGEESPSFHAQAKAAFDYLARSGSQTELITIEGLDHFDILLNGEHLKSFLRLADR